MKEVSLDRLEKRGLEYRISIYVLFAKEMRGEQGGAVAASR